MLRELRHRTKVLIALLATMLLIAGLLVWFATHPPLASLEIRYISFDDYWGGPMPPREGLFMVRNKRKGLVKIWGPLRVEFKNGNNTPLVGGPFGMVLPRHHQASVGVPLTGTEHGEWRVLVPVSDYRVVSFLENKPGCGTVAAFLDRHLQKSPRWVASDWMSQLPQRSTNPPPLPEDK
jgi:hypothetical protein